MYNIYLSLSLSLSWSLLVSDTFFLSFPLYPPCYFQFHCIYSHLLAVNTGCPEVLPAKKYKVQYQNGISSVSNAIDGISNDITVVRHSSLWVQHCFILIFILVASFFRFFFILFHIFFFNNWLFSCHTSFLSFLSSFFFLLPLISLFYFLSLIFVII